MARKALAHGVVFALAVALAFVAGRTVWRPARPLEASDAPLEPLRFATATQPVGALVYVAAAQGYFAKHGLAVTFRAHTSGRDALASVLSGRCDVAETAETPIVFAALRGEPVRTAATIATSPRGMAVVARKSEGIEAPNGLRGKTLAATFATNGEFFLDAFLLRHGIDKGDVTVVDLRPEQMVDALAKGDVDAVATWIPHTTRLQKALGEDSVSFYGEEIYTWSWNVATTQDYVSRHPGRLMKLLRALGEAETFIAANRKEAEGFVANTIGMSEDQLAGLWDSYNYRLSLGQWLLLSMEGQAEWAIRKTLFPEGSAPNYLSTFWLDGMDEVKPEAVSIIR